jgi:hypothetical protein
MLAMNSKNGELPETTFVLNTSQSWHFASTELAEIIA